jgi:hypothetical protein
LSLPPQNDWNPYPVQPLKIGADGPTCDEVFQGFAFQKFRDNKGSAILLTDVVNRADVWMI